MGWTWLVIGRVPSGLGSRWDSKTAGTSCNGWEVGRLAQLMPTQLEVLDVRTTA